MSRPQSFSEQFFSSVAEGVEDQPTVRAFQRLARMLGEWRQLLEHGPVPGAYLCVPLYVDATGTGVKSPRVQVPCSMKVLAVSYGLDATGDVNFRVRRHDGAAAATVFSGNATAAGQVDRAAGDFDTQTILFGDDVRIVVDAVNSGTPEFLQCILWCKRPGRIEP